MKAMSDVDFVKSSTLEIVVPDASDLDIEETLRLAADKDESALISSISQRNLLFFDEILPVYAVLRTPYKDEESLKSRIPRLAISLEGHAVSSPTIATPTGDRAGSSGNQSRDVIWTGKVDVSEEPFTVVAGSADSVESQDILLIWKVSATLGRPRIRLQAPAVIFKLSAALQPAQPSRENAAEQYLPDGVPLPSNILQPLEKDASLRGVIPQLSTLRFTRRSQATEALQREILPINVVSRKPFRAIPALSSRVKFHRSPFRVGTPSLVAALELDIPTFVQHPIEIKDIRLHLANGVVTSLGDEKIQALPMLCNPRDSIVWLYSIKPSVASVGAVPASLSQALEVTINVLIHVSTLCRPAIEIRFKANADFSISLPPSQAKTAQSAQRNVKTTNLVPGAHAAPGQVQTAAALQGAPGVSNETKLGIVIQFSAQETVHVGKPFKWGIFVINRSSRQRKLGLTMLSKRKSGGEKRISSRPTSTNATATNKTGSVADPFVDDNLLYTMIKSQAPEFTPLVCLNSDLRVGPLNPGACFTTEIEFLPLAAGFLHVEGIRVTDLSTNESVDIRDLPDVIALEERDV